MRISAIRSLSIPPIQNFSVSELGDFTVIAGRNGAGKSRLLQALVQKIRNPRQPNVELEIELTSEAEIKSVGRTGADDSGRVLSTVNQNERAHIQAIIQKNKRRQNFQSSVILYDSDRKVQNVAALQFQFEFADPFTENVGWDIGFQGLGNRWADTQHAIFKKIHRQTTSIASRARSLKAEGKTEMGLEFEDPLEPFRQIFERLLSPKKLKRADLQAQKLIVEHDGNEFPIDQLSSGEREVLSISFDLLLRKPSDCVIIFDEPELHLHPELLSRLMVTLQSIGERNQFIVVTHSPEIISAADPNAVIFVRQSNGSENQAVKLADEQEATTLLHELGQSLGVISLGKKIVLIEGGQSSLDKLTYLEICKSEFPELVLLPASGRDRIRSFADFRSEILDKSLWGIKFFMLTDGDCGPNLTEGGGLRKLPRYHVENYFLDERLIARIFGQMDGAGSDLADEAIIEAKLRELAREDLSYAAALRSAAELRSLVGSADLMPKGVNRLNRGELTELIFERTEAELSRISEVLSREKVEEIVSSNFDMLERSIEGSDDWKRLFPAKPIVAKFCSFTRMPAERFKRLYIREDVAQGTSAFAEVKAIFEEFAKA